MLEGLDDDQYKQLASIDLSLCDVSFTNFVVNDRTLCPACVPRLARVALLTDTSLSAESDDPDDGVPDDGVPDDMYQNRDNFFNILHRSRRLDD